MRALYGENKKITDGNYDIWLDSFYQDTYALEAGAVRCVPAYTRLRRNLKK